MEPAEQLKARLPRLTLEELGSLLSMDRATYPEQVTMVERELARRGVTGLTVEGQHLELRPGQEKGWSGWLSSAIGDEKSALRVARQGAIAAWVVSGATVIIGLLAQKIPAFSAAGIDAWSLIDAALFAAIGFGIWKGSVSFAWAGLLLFVLERGLMWATTGRYPHGLGVLLFLAFVNSIRGARALQHFRGTTANANGIPQ